MVCVYFIQGAPEGSTESGSGDGGWGLPYARKLYRIGMSQCF